MTIDEFSYEFDVLASSYFREGGFSVSDSSLLAFNEYEKSVYLTREQENFVLSLYSDSSAYGSFERTEQLRRDLENLIETKVVDPVDVDFTHIADGSQFFRLATAVPPTPASDTESGTDPGDAQSVTSYVDDWNLWFIVYEAGRYASDADAKCPVDNNDFPVEIVPVTYDTFHRIKGNPFRGPNERRALRLDNGKRVYNYVEILPKHRLSKYYVKFIRRPEPIVLTKLEGGLCINGVSEARGCELHSSLHRLILDGAVRAAVSSRMQPSAEEK